MAMAANPPLSPQSVAVSSATDNGDATPQTWRKNLPSPWAQVVRGVENLSTVTAGSVSPSPRTPSVVSDCPEPGNFIVPSGQKFSLENISGESCNTDDNANRSKKPAWKKPTNGVTEPVSVMGGSISWPALSESTRSMVKTSSDSTSPPSEGSTSSSQGPIISQPPQRQVNTHPNLGLHRQRSMRHRPVGGSAQSVYNRSPPPPPPTFPPFPILEMPPYMNYANFVPPPALDSHTSRPRSMGAVGMQASNDHSQRNSSRRNNFGPRPRGEGQYHHGGRRDPDRRDVHVPHQFIPRGFIPPPPPPPPGSAPFVVPPHVRHMVNPMAFDMTPQFVYVPTLPPEPLRPVPLMAQGSRPPSFFSAIDTSLSASIVRQIDYYFSDSNLIKDDYLRSNMDDEGWVSISLIAGFPRMKVLLSTLVHQRTADIPLILDSLRSSAVVEIKGNKIRKRNDWQRWIHSSSRMLHDSVSQAPSISSEDNLQTSIKKMSLNDAGRSNLQVEIFLPDESPNVSEGTAEEACSSQT